MGCYLIVQVAPYRCSHVLCLRRLLLPRQSATQLTLIKLSTEYSEAVLFHARLLHKLNLPGLVPLLGIPFV